MLTWQPALSTAAENGWQLLCTRSRLSPSSHPQTHSHRGWEDILHAMATHISLTTFPENPLHDQDYQLHSQGFSYRIIETFQAGCPWRFETVLPCARLPVSFVWACRLHRLKCTKYSVLEASVGKFSQFSDFRSHSCTRTKNIAIMYSLHMHERISYSHGQPTCKDYQLYSQGFSLPVLL